MLCFVVFRELSSGKWQKFSQLILPQVAFHYLALPTPQVSAPVLLQMLSAAVTQDKLTTKLEGIKLFCASVPLYLLSLFAWTACPLLYPKASVLPLRSSAIRVPQSDFKKHCPQALS